MTTATTLNPTQKYLLQMFSFSPTDETQKELQKLISDYYFEKVEAMAQKIWDEKGLSPDKLDEMCKKHLRTEYK